MVRKIQLQMDGNQICATWDSFDCLAVSPAGFGDTIGESVSDLIKNTQAHELNGIVSSIENAHQADVKPPNTKDAIDLLKRWLGPERHDRIDAQVKLEIESKALIEGEK